MRIGVFGGTFDPVHLGHLILAEQCREQAALDQVWFVPAARPPHKLNHELTPFARRVEMLALAVAGHAPFRVEEIERDRPGPSYTADTLEELAAKHPNVDWHFILGSDSLPDLPLWHEPLRVLRMAQLLVVARPGHPIMAAEELRTALALPADAELRMQTIEAPLIEIASSDLRRRTRQGRSLRYLVPRAVECYIEDKGLYREN
jgi:nicotinate-nucleotide adenylyltransferase